MAWGRKKSTYTLIQILLIKTRPLPFPMFLNKNMIRGSWHWKLGSKMLYWLISIGQLHGFLCPNFLKPQFIFFLDKAIISLPVKLWIAFHFEDDFFLWPTISFIFFLNWIVYAKQDIKLNKFLLKNYLVKKEKRKKKKGILTILVISHTKISYPIHSV